MSYSDIDHMIDFLTAEEYEGFTNGKWDTEEEFEYDELNPDERYEDEYDYDRDALKKVLIKWEADNPGYHSIWVAPDGSWFPSTLEAYFYCSENEDYRRLLFNAFEAGCEASRWGSGDQEDDFMAWSKHLRTA
jgi:hypothetical protein